MSSFSVTRAANGQIVMSLNDVKDYNLKEAGTITGSVSFSLSQTDNDTDETVLILNQDKVGSAMDFIAEATANSFDFQGQNVNADFNAKNSKAYNVSWGVDTGTFDSSKSKSSVIIETTKDSANSEIKTGTSSSKILNKYDNLIFDGGKNNVFNTTSDATNRYETTSTSQGAVVNAGNGKNDFYIGGSYGVFNGGSGTDTFYTNKDASHNIILGNAGSDNIVDYGKNSLFIGGAGYDIAELHGEDGIFNLGFDEEGKVTFGNGSKNNYAFTGREQIDSYGNIYNYAEIMKEKGWDLETFLVNSGLKDTPYYTQFQSKLKEIFQ